jgi:hypothetical protein
VFSGEISTPIVSLASVHHAPAVKRSPGLWHRSGLQWAAIKNLVVLLQAAMITAGLLYIILRQIF